MDKLAYGGELTKKYCCALPLHVQALFGAVSVTHKGSMGAEHDAM